MRLDRPVYWHQGLFLQPQHFQLADLGHGERHHRFTELTQPYAWGVAGMQLEDSALAAGQLQFTRLSLRFRDGALAEFPGNAVIESRGFDPTTFSEGRVLHVGVRRFSPGQRNVTVFDSLDQAAQADTRFATLADPESIADIFAEGPEAHVRPLYLVLRLFWENEVEHSSEYELMPVAQIEPEGESVRLSAHFIPPCLNIGGSPVLLQIVRELRDGIVARARQLEVYKASRELQSGDFDPAHWPFMLALLSLNRYGAALSHTLDCSQLHPWTVYGVLRSLLGELSAFSDRCDLLGETPDGQTLAPPYRHNELGAGFFALQQAIPKILNEITLGPEMLARLQPREADFFGAELSDQFFAARNRHYLLVRSEDVGAEELLNRFGSDAKLGAPSDIDHLIERALPGAELEHLTTAPVGMPRRSGVQYFRIEQLSEAWEAIERAREAVLYWPEAPSDLQVDLVVVRR